jgi:Bax protein
MTIYKIILSVLLLSIVMPSCAKSDVRVVETKSYADVLTLFNEIGFTAEQWQAGIREVPRIEITRIPKRWQEQSPNIPIKDKKNVFFRLTGPGILIENEKIAADRKQLLNAIKNNKTNNDQWLLQLAKKYKVIKTDRHTLDETDLAGLKNRVDIIPLSLALAQAAEESGWGTSRFAIQGNSLFGQWDFSGNGIKPKNQRKELGN